MGKWSAACACGAVTLEIDGTPLSVAACCCRACQRDSGSVFTYSAFFAQDDVRVEGRCTLWQWQADSGRSLEAAFCPTCGITLFARLEAVQDALSIPVGLLGDSGFPPPGDIYWTSRRHSWWQPDPHVCLHDRQ